MNNIQLEQAEKHIRNAWIVGAISTTITLLFSFIGAYNEDIRFKYGLDTWSLIDVALMAGLTYGIYKKKRFAALIFLIYFLLSKFIMAASTGQFTGGAMSLIFAYFLFQGTRSSFQLHRHLIDTGEIVKDDRKKGVWYYVNASVIGLIVIIVIVLMVIGNNSPDIEVVPGKQLNKEYIDFIRNEGIIDKSENVKYWYSDGFTDFKDGFYFFTDKRVVVYSQEWDEPAIIIPYSEIVRIEFEQDPSFLEDSRITLELIDNTSVYFPISSENGGDEKYYSSLLETWNANSGYLE